MLVVRGCSEAHWRHHRRNAFADELYDEAVAGREQDFGSVANSIEEADPDLQLSSLNSATEPISEVDLQKIWEGKKPPSTVFGINTEVSRAD